MSSPPPDPKRAQERTQKLKRIFLGLILIGLIAGGFLAFGVVKVMQRFGLTDNQPQIEQR
ncbi:hypothetical protein IQ241_11015 [Romeria aff. gracilis LEGE 07310]|uniref:Uncharacterized protein n=1 Tax=Vasconcelosia minhoensis LEGE 07310 TaxID=915328 RepID=A0A8J7AXF3_9CYAN|nr:hypothetical protein [Romeria gracilis]MBE9077817.1 hypothetical protein [Romeria aff. gracilis LEGE 07310]